MHDQAKRIASAARRLLIADRPPPWYARFEAVCALEYASRAAVSPLTTSGAADLGWAAGCLWLAREAQ